MKISTRFLREAGFRYHRSLSLALSFCRFLVSGCLAGALLGFPFCGFVSLRVRGKSTLVRLWVFVCDAFVRHRARVWVHWALPGHDFVRPRDAKSGTFLPSRFRRGNSYECCLNRLMDRDQFLWN